MVGEGRYDLDCVSQRSDGFAARSTGSAATIGEADRTFGVHCYSNERRCPHRRSLCHVNDDHSSPKISRRAALRTWLARAAPLVLLTACAGPTGSPATGRIGSTTGPGSVSAGGPALAQVALGNQAGVSQAAA